MTTSPIAGRFAQLVGTLWDAYAIFDGARDPLVWKTLEGVDPTRRRCLYGGVLAREIIEVAPHLVGFSREGADWNKWNDGFGKSWGIYFASAADVETLRKHFKRFLRVRDEAGRDLLFRFYDPRVLRAYLPTCTAEELFEFFGPVKSFFIEGPNPGELLIASHEGGKLQLQSEVSLPG